MQKSDGQPEHGGELQAGSKRSLMRGVAQK